MTKKDILNLVRVDVADVIDWDPNEIHSSTSLYDSNFIYNHKTLRIALSNSFFINISYSVAKHWNTVGDIVNWLHVHLTDKNFNAINRKNIITDVSNIVNLLEDGGSGLCFSLEPSFSDINSRLHSKSSGKAYHAIKHAKVSDDNPTDIKTALLLLEKTLENIHLTSLFCVFVAHE